MTAAEALKKARATALCPAALQKDCQTLAEPFYSSEIKTDLALADWHLCVASALLDGFSVRQLTAVGG